jgi:hypothetical protein
MPTWLRFKDLRVKVANIIAYKPIYPTNKLDATLVLFLANDAESYISVSAALVEIKSLVVQLDKIMGIKDA